MINSTVAQLVTPDGTWKWASITPFLPDEVGRQQNPPTKKTLKAHFPPTNNPTPTDSQTATKQSPPSKHTPYIPYAASPQNLAWLEKSAVVFMAEETDFDGLEDNLKKDGFSCSSIKLLGSCKVLLSFDSIEVMTSSIDTNHDLLSQYFDSIDHWSPDMVSYARLSWITCYRIPLHVWDKDFFLNFGNHFGKFLGVDAATAEKESFECARIIICTERREPINKVQRIRVGDKFHDIAIFEDIIHDFVQIANDQNIVFWGFDSNVSEDDAPSSSENLPPPPDHQPSPQPILSSSKIVDAIPSNDSNSLPFQDNPPLPPPSLTTHESPPKHSSQSPRGQTSQFNSNSSFVTCTPNCNINYLSHKANPSSITTPTQPHSSTTTPTQPHSLPFPFEYP
ncbi:hypothetical protein Tsubulata_022793 [Turnera subulata]|uniref:DUF4283 domain-containing protein n=1 Tax=Turnera subulata TaxID=218843 RepID=A0A9Q0F1Z6_9ROSI|nr:hypothetical protein Tsubulata_022793 [Turnera subulata]